LIYIFPRTIGSNQNPEDFGLAYENVVFTSNDGVELDGWFIPSQKGEENAPSLIFLHGYPAEKGDLLWMAYPYHQTYNVLLFDFRALGESKGWISTLGYREAQDVEAAVKYLSGRGHDRIGIWGFSMGAAAALLADYTEEVDAIAVDSSYASIEDMSRYVYRILWPADILLGNIQIMWAQFLLGVDAEDISPVEKIRGVDKPLLISYSPEDEVIPVSQHRALRDAVRGQMDIYVWEHVSSGHGIMEVDYQEYVHNFFDTYLLDTESI